MESNERNIPFGKPLIDDNEKKAVLDILNGPILVHGPKSKEFEEKFCEFTKAPHASSLASCTAGLHLAYFLKGIGNGDEVIVPAQTHTATVHAVEFVGATPKFVDAEPKTGNIDTEQLESALTPRTRAISVVHYLGMPAEMDKIMAFARKHQLFVVEDCALAIGATFNERHVGLHGDIGLFSFYPVKHMTTAEGGMAIMNEEAIFKKITRLKAFGVDRHVGERKIPGMYDVTQLGYNYRMNEIEAAIGVEQIKKMPSFLQTRERNYSTLEKELTNIDEITLFQSTHGKFKSSYYCLSILLKQPFDELRTSIIESMKKRGVGVSIYYPQAVPHFSYYREKYGYTKDSFPVASRISRSTIALSVGPHLTEEDMIYIASSLKESIRENK